VVKKEYLDLTFSDFLPSEPEDRSVPASDNSAIPQQLDILNQKVDVHTFSLDAHTATVEKHTAALEKHSAILQEHTAALQEVSQNLQKLTDQFAAKATSDADQFQILKNMISHFYTSMAKSAYREKEKRMPPGITEEEKIARRKEVFDEIDRALPTTLPKPSSSTVPTSSTAKPSSSSTIIPYKSHP